MCPNRHILSFYFLKLTLSVKGTTVFLHSRLFFQKGLTVSTKMVKCFDKKEDVSILTHPHLLFHKKLNGLFILYYW